MDSVQIAETMSNPLTNLCFVIMAVTHQTKKQWKHTKLITIAKVRFF